MGEAVEKYRLSKDQVQFSKNYGNLQKLKNVLTTGIQYKMSELQQMQRVLHGVNLQVEQYLQSAPTETPDVDNQPAPENLQINY